MSAGNTTPFRSTRRGLPVTCNKATRSLPADASTGMSPKGNDPGIGMEGCVLPVSVCWSGSARASRVQGVRPACVHGARAGRGACTPDCVAPRVGTCRKCMPDCVCVCAWVSERQGACLLCVCVWALVCTGLLWEPIPSASSRPITAWLSFSLHLCWDVLIEF